MYMKKKKILIPALLVLALCFMISGFFTAYKSFSIPIDKGNNWNVNISNVKSDDIKILSDDINNISLYVPLNKKVAKVSFKIVNDGDYDAILDEIKASDLSNILVGSSKSLKTLYASDYVTYKIVDEDYNDLSKKVIKSHESINAYILFSYKYDVENDKENLLDNGFNFNALFEFKQA